MEKNFSKEVHAILREQMGDISEHIIRKQCYDLGIMPEYIPVTDLPDLSIAIANAIERSFGQKKADRAYEALLDLLTIADKMDYIVTTIASLEPSRDGTESSKEFIRAMKYYNELMLLSKNEKKLKEMVAESKQGQNMVQQINMKLMEVGQAHKRFVKKDK